MGATTRLAHLAAAPICPLFLLLRILRRVRDGACGWFRAVLSPDYNAAHRDHLHLDYGRWSTCR